MKKISRKNIPTRLPLGTSLLIYVCLDIYSAPEWLWTLAILFISLAWGFSIYSLSTEKLIDIFEKESKEFPANPNKKESKFQERLRQEMNK